MRKKRKILPFLISLVSCGIIAYIITYYPPTLTFSVFNYKFSILYVFLISLFIFVTYFFAYILKSLRRGLFISLFITGFLLLNLSKLEQPIFVILLIAIFVALELLFTRRK